MHKLLMRRLGCKTQRFDVAQHSAGIVIPAYVLDRVAKRVIPLTP